MAYFDTVQEVKLFVDLKSKYLMINLEMVGVERFELPALWSQTRCATRLRYTPTVFSYPHSSVFSSLLNSQRQFYFTFLASGKALMTFKRQHQLRIWLNTNFASNPTI